MFDMMRTLGPQGVVGTVPGRGGGQPIGFKLRDVMSRPVTIAPEATLNFAAITMSENNVGMLPVVDGSGGVLGVITDRDVAVRGYGTNLGPNALVGQITLASSDLERVWDDDDLKTAEEAMKAARVRRLLVFSRTTRVLVGVLSIDDLAMWLGHKRSGAILERVAQASCTGGVGTGIFA